MTEEYDYTDDVREEGQYVEKSYQFERDMDIEEHDKRFDTLRFGEESNTHFAYHDMEHLLTTDDGKETLINMLKTFFDAQKERLSILDGYSKGENYTILEGRRRLEQNKSDYRISHNWGGYISNYITGYLMSEPITIGTSQPDDDESETLKTIKEINTDNDINTLDFDLGFDASRYGRAFEVHYRSSDKKDKIVLVDAQEIFIIRSVDVTKEIIGAVHVPVYNGQVHVTIYTDTKIIKYHPFNEGVYTLNENESGSKPHFYKMVPVVEWQNNRFRQGDFEPVIPSIDAYDSAQSDTANYMSDLNDALLVVSGDFASSGLTPKDFAVMLKANFAMLESGVDHMGKQTSLTAEYLYKQYDVAGTEAYKDRLLNDIHSLSNVPDLNDDKFNSAQSGVALQYKMLGLGQIKSIKESLYSKALKRRYQLIENVHQGLSDKGITANDLTFTFHTNVPEDVWAEVEKYISSGGEMSVQTLMELASFIGDVDEEKRRMLVESLGPQATDEEKEFVLRGGTNGTDEATDL